MTDEMMSLRALLEKISDAELLRVVGFAVQRLVELEMGSLTDTAHDERSPARLNQLSGYRDRSGHGRRIPKLRKGRYFPAIGASFGSY